MDKTQRRVNEMLETQDFYEACQSYRNAPMTDQARVVATFDHLKAFIQKEMMFEPQQSNEVFIESERLGLLSPRVAALLTDTLKRKRQSNFKELEHMLTLLGLLPKGFKAHFMGMCADRNGQVGLLVVSEDATRVQANMPGKE